MILTSSASYRFYRFLSLDIWGGVPAYLQKKISQLYTSIYNMRFSRWFIKPYCWFNYKDRDYLEQFKPASGGNKYINFQDFFTRALRNPINIEGESVWPCEGLLCEYGQVSKTPMVKVKGQWQHLRSIFGKSGESIPNHYYFSNVFLHNNNYHRIHSPVSGKIKKISRIPGELVLLRPWIYRNDPSLPALRNERINVDIEAENGELWYLSIVGGPAVGTIEMHESCHEEAEVKIGQEISTFLLGSTCCMASPIPVGIEVNEAVRVGKPL